MVGSVLCAFSSPAEKAAEIINELKSNEGVVSLKGDRQELVTYHNMPDSTQVVLVHSLKDNSVDTLAHHISGYEIMEAVPFNEEDYLTVRREARSDGNGHYLYVGAIRKNYKDRKNNIRRTLLGSIPSRVDRGSLV